MPDAPILVLLAAPLAFSDGGGCAAEFAGGRKVLGLSLVRRAALAGRRAGFGKVLLLGAPASLLAEPSAIADWAGLAASLPRAAPLVIASAAILAETDWLARLAEFDAAPAAWAALSCRIVSLPPSTAPEALRALDAVRAADLSAVEAALARRFGLPAKLPAGVDPLAVDEPGDVREAERRLLRKLVKDTDGFMARHFERPVSLQISRLLAPTAITPNQMSLVSVAVGVWAGPFFLSWRPVLQTIGALLFLAHSILDGCDGELARLKFQQSRLGGVLDFWGDNIVHGVVFACMAVGWSWAAGSAWPLLLGAAAVLGTLCSAGFVYWRLMRAKDGGEALFTSVSAEPDRPLSRMLDAASRRDFIYLVILLALAGKSNWFLVLAGIGSPIYCLLVLFAAARERRSGDEGDSHAVRSA